MNRFHLSCISLIVFISCDTPFSTKPSNDEDLFVVSHDYDQTPIFHKTIKDIFKIRAIPKINAIGFDHYFLACIEKLSYAL